MILTLLCVIFSHTLNFDGLTLPILFQWYCNHPFLFMLALGEIFSYTVNVKG
jgi:hypothetical protein